MLELSTIEICAGAGGQALGLESAGFQHVGLVEIDKQACTTLRHNRPDWDIFEMDLKEFDGSKYQGIDLLSGGLPCPPFSQAGKKLGKKDERNMFPEAIRLIDECRPKAVLIENVKGLLDPRFEGYRKYFNAQVKKLGYNINWGLLNAANYGVSQQRLRVVFVAIQKKYANTFSWPSPLKTTPPTVGELLYDQMASKGWREAKDWSIKANKLAPTIVGGSKKHGGPDLGPTGAKKAWEKLYVNGRLIAKEAPEENFTGMPYLTVKMVSRIQGFPDDWEITGLKTAAYNQVGNAFPPLIAKAVGEQIAVCLTNKVMISLAV